MMIYTNQRAVTRNFIVTSDAPNPFPIFWGYHTNSNTIYNLSTFLISSIVIWKILKLIYMLPPIHILMLIRSKIKIKIKECNHLIKYSIQLKLSTKCFIVYYVLIIPSKNSAMRNFHFFFSMGIFTKFIIYYLSFTMY